jgi:hypothetical protein
MDEYLEKLEKEELKKKQEIKAQMQENLLEMNKKREMVTDRISEEMNDINEEDLLKME